MLSHIPIEAFLERGSSRGALRSMLDVASKKLKLHI